MSQATNRIRALLYRFEPAVSRRALAILSGSVWWAVGIGLVITSSRWLDGAPTNQAAILGAVGLLGALVAGKGFDRIARKNLLRLENLPDRRCVFAFQPWRGYGTILVMVALGWALRHSPIPKPWLVPIYLSVGAGLIRGGIAYFRWTPGAEKI